MKLDNLLSPNPLRNTWPLGKYMLVMRYVQCFDGLASPTCQFAEDQNPTVIKEVNKQMRALLREEGSCRSGENVLSMMMLAVLL